MSKKHMKRSLALGALMAFVITGSAMAKEINVTIKPSEIGTYAVDGSLTVNVGQGMNGISAGNSTSDSDVNVNLTGDLVVNSDLNGIALRAENDSVLVNSNIKADNIYVTSTNGVGLDIYGHHGGSTKQNTFVIEAVNDLSIKTVNGRYAVQFKGQRHDQTVTIKAGDELNLIGTVRADNEKQFNIEGKTITIDAGECEFGIYSDNSDVNVIATDKITISAADKGVYAASRYNDTKGVELTANTIEIEAVNALYAKAKGTLTVGATENAEIKGNIISDADCSVGVDAGNDVIVGGKVLAEKGQIFVEAANDVTVNGNVESRSGEGAGDLPYVSIKGGNDVVVNGSLTAHWAQGSKDGTRKYGLEIKGKNVSVDAGEKNVLYNGAGKTNLVAEDSLNLFGNHVLVNEGGTIDVTANKINITAAEGGCAVISYANDTVIAPTEGGSSNIVGDILVDSYYEKNIPKVDVALGNSGSLKGAVINEYGNTKDYGVNLDLGAGSTWTVTGDSNVSTLAGSGNVDVADLETSVAVVTDETGDITVSTSSDNLGVDVNADMKTLKALVATTEGVELADKLMFTAGKYYDDVIGEVDKNGNINITQDKTINEANINISDAAALGLMSWRAEMNDMNKRMGELRNANGERGVWVRMVRGEDEYKSVNHDYTQYQLGYDEKLSVDKRWTVGMALSYTDGETSFAKGNGENTNKALSIYGSKLNDDGTFVDLIAKYARLENEFNVTDGIGGGDYSTNGYSFSAEFGKRIQQGKGLWIEPQVELTYGKVSAVDYVTKNDVNVAQDGMESIVGRVGFSVGKDIEKGNVYARASYLYDFDGETSVNLDGRETLEQDLGGGWWEVGVGANINLSKATYIYADVEKTFGGEVDTNWQWNLGVRYSF